MQKPFILFIRGEDLTDDQVILAESEDGALTRLALLGADEELSHIYQITEDGEVTEYEPVFNDRLKLRPKIKA